MTVVHMLCLGWWLRVWLWHTSLAAQTLPGSTGFGWFFRYLTFYSFTLQLLQLLLCTVHGLSRKWQVRYRIDPRVETRYWRPTLASASKAGKLHIHSVQNNTTKAEQRNQTDWCARQMSRERQPCWVVGPYFRWTVSSKRYPVCWSFSMNKRVGIPHSHTWILHLTSSRWLRCA